MSKSKKNVIEPDVLLEKYGADVTRLFCLFAAPPEKDLEWSEQGVEGAYRFLNRIWRLATSWMDLIGTEKPYSGSPDDLKGDLKTLYKATHQTIKKVTNDIEERFHFNTAISAVMELVNISYGIDPDNDSGRKDPNTAQVMRYTLESIVLLMSPIVPHLSEELWRRLGHKRSVLVEPWPEFLEEALAKDTLLIVVQVNGKLRSRFHVSPDADERTIQNRALGDERVKKFVGDKPVKRVIVVKRRLVNIVV
jgi:leucyl-tRNA synthetase